MDLLVGIFLIVLAGAGGFFVARFTNTARKTRELQTRLEAKQTELDDYRREVFEQFGETAQKFKTLNESYVDLHRQIARSASLLCGDMGAENLLEAPLTGQLQAEPTSTVASSTLDDTTDSKTEEPSDNIRASDPELVTINEHLSEIDDIEVMDEVTEATDQNIKTVVTKTETIVEDIESTDNETEGEEVETSDKRKQAASQSVDVPTLEISQALADNEVDNSNWESALEIVLEKLKQEPSNTMGESDQESTQLRNAG